VTHPKHAGADHDIHDLIRRRWSPRAFDPDRAVGRAELLRLLEAARWAPSSFNEQPWRFVVVDRGVDPDRWRAFLDTLAANNRAWADSAPILLLAAARVTIERTGAPNPLAWYDTGQAVACLSIQATAQGLSLRQMEGFDREAARRVCDVPDAFEPLVAMALGYAGDPDALASERHRASERQPRRRKPLGEIVFEGRWGIHLQLGNW
jgi:nitroreductase